MIDVPYFSRDRFLSEFTKALVDGYDSCSVAATPRHPVPRFDTPPYVQFMWTDDQLLQLEVVSDQYLNMPYSDWQIDRLCFLGFEPPFAIADDAPNWTTFVEPHATTPGEVARLLTNALWLITEEYWSDPTESLGFWNVEWRSADDATPWSDRLRDDCPMKPTDR